MRDTGGSGRPSRIVVLNCGSATVKLGLYEESPSQALRGRTETVEVRGDYRGTLDRLIAGLPWRPDLVGHRVVHGGRRFRTPVVIEGSVERDLEALSRLAPLHNPPALEGIRAARILGIPMVACFDTAFHATLPERAWRYPLPEGIDAEVRRYGFHGLSHQFVTERYVELTGRELPTIITLHLGGGCSAAAIQKGVCVDTSMGWGPLEGLVMGTRAGDLDPAILLHLLRAGKSVEELDRILNRECGLKALAGTGDMRDILARSDPAARLAVDIFCYRVRKYIGAYLAALGGAEGVVFTGGIGENSPEVRRLAAEGLEWAGLRIDEARNRAGAGRISTDDSPLAAYVIPTDEELVIARETVQRVHGTSNGGTA
jgi:acetate kinase